TVEVPAQHNLRQNHPNPFSTSTSISFSLSGPALVTVEVLDALGVVRQRLRGENYIGGEHTVSLDTARLPSGVYFYRLRAEDLIQTRRMVVVR
ncbi:MAG: T9SS type A sorting domain-containing protein, partial [Rhodothermales bacterium]|nr:T9SS type A sorting domain-containing protein [Rhodothermales bacterium]